MSKNHPSSRKIAFALGGGGSRGALQVGALQSLLEHNIYPDIIVGTSIGGANGAFLALDLSLKNLRYLHQAWKDAMNLQLIEGSPLRIGLRTLMNRFEWRPNRKLIRFYYDHLPRPDLTFGEVTAVDLYMTATDLVTGNLYLFGKDPTERVLDGLVATTAIPPWIRPVTRDHHRFIDGGLVSNVPILSAIEQGATTVIALDLSNPHRLQLSGEGFYPLFVQMMTVIETRQRVLEEQIAAERHIPVYRIPLYIKDEVPIWDNSRALELMETGYELMEAYLRQNLIPMEPEVHHSWLDYFKRRPALLRNKE